ncbi:metal-dependent transcriptional regulator [Maribacter sp. ACAM166]|uniref:metal-dependent transcriptional regulator n=1 Tax=Maribacter sp. ACAM166 TaxID=2508996 RepID=UPI0010FF03CE|nr:metal-dependent transcriptional regulator [Maribacter sp. ACAM166]TLP71201.1 metal-dependent transcriptional regulator [Maribacter sp. ACAM166]
MTLSEEDYIKAIYHLSQIDSKSVATNAIAEQMKTKPSSVTDMIKKLSKKSLVNYKKYQGVSLSEEGRMVALSIIRKHRLWEVFMVNKLNFSWDEVHVVAEQLEHIKSDTLIDRLDAHLGFPKVDPHGDPIPTKEGTFKKSVKKLISELPILSEGVCIGVNDSSAAFLKFLDKNKIALGDTFKILDREDFDGSVSISTRVGTIRISEQIASNLYLEIRDAE